MRNKKEYIVGEIFRFNEQTFQCVASEIPSIRCKKCAMPHNRCGTVICDRTRRYDLRDVHFIRVTKPEDGMLFRASDGVLYELIENECIHYMGDSLCTCYEIDQQAFGDILSNEFHWYPVKEKRRKMKKELKLKLIYFFEQGKKIYGAPASVCGDASEIWGNLTNIKGSVTGLQGNVSGINGDVTHICGDVTRIRGNVTYISGIVSNILGKINGITGDVTELLNDVSGITGEVSNLKGDASGLFGNVTGISGDITGIYGDATHIRGDVTGIRGDVTNLIGDVTGIIGDVSGIIGVIDNCDVTHEDRKHGVHIMELVGK